jgi:hypothetical protein
MRVLNRVFLLLGLWMCFAGISRAQTTVTGTVVGANSTPTASSAFVRFRLQNFAGNIPRLNGSAPCASGAVLPFVVDVKPNSSGAISQVICGNDVIAPQTCGVGGSSPCTFYTVEYWYQGAVQYAWNFSITGGSFNLDTAVPLPVIPNPPNPPSSSAIPGGAFSTKTMAYTLTLNDGWVNVTGSTTIKVPHAIVCQLWTVFNSGSNTVTLEADSGNFNGTTSVSLSANTGMSVTCDGTNCFGH